MNNITNKDILNAALEKAEQNGYEVPPFVEVDTNHGVLTNAYQIIFSHDFARAFFGEAEFYGNSEHDPGNPIKVFNGFEYEYRLTEMALSGDPLSVLSKHL